MKNNNLSDMMMEQYVLNELPEKQIIEINKLSEQDTELKGRIEAIGISNKEILNIYPEEKITSEILAKYESFKAENKTAAPLMEAKTAGKRYRLLKRYLFPVITVAAAGFLFFLLPVIKTSFYDVVKSDNTDITRQKGDDSAIYIYRKKNNNIENILNGSTAKRGDLLQIVYSSKDKYGVIFSIDGRGTVTLHFPGSINSSAKLTTGKKIRLNNSYELDDAPDFERFFLITSGSDLDVNNILNAAHILAKNNRNAMNGEIEIKTLNNKINQASIKVIKEKQ